MYYTYILESQSTGMYYYGHCDDIQRRLKEHNANQTKYTRGKGPWKLVFCRSFSTRSEAMELEKELKRVKNKAYIYREYIQPYQKQ